MSSRAAEVGYSLDSVRSLVGAIRATDDLTIHDDDDLQRLSDIVNLVNLIDTVTISAIEQLGTIEVDVRHLAPEAR